MILMIFEAKIMPITTLKIISGHRQDHDLDNSKEL